MHLIEIEEEKELEIEEENKEEKKVKINYIVNNQLTKINDTIAKIKNQLFIALVAYDEYYKRYYVENKEKIKSAKIACRLINKKEEEK